MSSQLYVLPVSNSAGGVDCRSAEVGSGAGGTSIIPANRRLPARKKIWKVVDAVVIFN